MANLNITEFHHNGTPTYFKEKIQAWLYMSAGTKVSWDLESSYNYQHSVKYGVKQLAIIKDKGVWHAGRAINFTMNGVQFAPVVPAYIGFLTMQYTSKNRLILNMNGRTMQEHEIENFVQMDGFGNQQDFIHYHFKSKPSAELKRVVVYFGHDFNF